MIDRATGGPAVVPMMLLCPSCGRRQRTTREAHDPASAAVIVVDCDKHEDAGAQVAYFDRNGREVCEDPEKATPTT